jgi:hypothetical protein
MKFELKPMSFGEVLDGAFKVLRSNLVLFLSIEALFSLPTSLVSTWSVQAAAVHRRQPFGPHLYVTTLVTIVLSFLAWGASSAAAVQTVFGEPTSVRKALARYFRVFWPTFGASVVIMFIGGLCSLLLVFPGIVYYLRRSLYWPVLIVEGGTTPDALMRSKVLVMGKNKKGRLDRVFGATVVFGAFVWVLIFGIGMLIPAGLKNTFVGGMLRMVPAIVTGPLLPISLVLIYFDARVRDEGYDLELRAQAARAAPPSTPASLPGAAGLA